MQDLLNDSVVFSRLIEEYGKQEQEEKEKVESEEAELAAEVIATKKPKKAQAGLMQAEERVTGSVTWSVYSEYLRYAGGLFWAPIIVILLTLTQGASVANNLFLGFWTAESISGFRQGDYMATYAALGIAAALFAMSLSYSFR